MNAHTTAPTTAPVLVTVKTAADLTSLSARTLYRAMTRGELKSLKIGAARRITTKALADWVDAFPTCVKTWERRHGAGAN